MSKEALHLRGISSRSTLLKAISEERFEIMGHEYHSLSAATSISCEL